MGACCAKAAPEAEQAVVADGTPIGKDAIAVVVPLSDKKKELVNEFYQKLCNHGGDAEWYTNVCTEDCMFNPPGAPPLPISACSGMFNAMHESFPDWEPVVVVPAQEDSKEITVHSQQKIGNLKSDLPPIGPFHGVTLDEASERAKTGEGLVLPFERGTVTFNDDGTKIANVKYSENSVVKEASLEGVTSMDISPPVGIYCLFKYLGKPLPTVPEEKVELCTKFLNNLIRPESEDWHLEICTEDCVFNPPGAPPMKIAEVSSMFGVMFGSTFPDWEPRLTVPDQPDGTTITCHTQQYVGNMKADMPASGPFPGVTLDEASDRAKTGEPLCLPFEKGTWTFNEEGTKIVSVAYGEDSVVEGQDMEGVTSMDLDPPVGMVCLYRWMGIDSFPPKPEEDQV